MRDFGKLGESVRSTALAAGLSLAAVTAVTATATAQNANDIISQTTYESLSQANTVAQQSGLVLVRGYHGRVMMVNPATAQELEKQGFRYDNRRILFGYGAGVPNSGFSLRDAGSNGIFVTIEQSDGDRDNSEDNRGGRDTGTDTDTGIDTGTDDTVGL